MENKSPQNPTSSTPIPSIDSPVLGSETVKKTSKFSIKAIIGTIIFLLLAGGAAASFVYREQIMTLVTVPTPTSIATPTPPPIPEKDVYAAWNTYVNEEDEFSIQYPTGWTQLYDWGEQGQSSVAFSSKGVSSGEGFKPAIVSIDKFETSKLDPDWEKNYTPYDFELFERGKYTYIIMATTYQIGGPAPKSIEDLARSMFKLMIPTFKFIQTTPLGTAGWSTFENEKLIIKHPTSWKSRSGGYDVSLISEDFVEEGGIPEITKGFLLSGASFEGTTEENNNYGPFVCAVVKTETITFDSAYYIDEMDCLTPIIGQSLGIRKVDQNKAGFYLILSFPDENKNDPAFVKEAKKLLQSLVLTLKVKY